MAISAVCKGIIEKVNITIKYSSPYFDLERKDLLPDQVLVLEAIQKFLETVTSAPKKIPRCSR